MKFLLKILALSLTVLLISGCSSDGDSDNSAVGYFVDDPVSGLTYECSSGTVGVTDLDGEYTCENGDNVTFSIGGVLIGTVAAEDGIVTPYTFFPNNQDAAINIARLLQSVDTNTSDDIITLDPILVALLNVNTDFTSPTFEADVEGDLSITLVSVEDAQTQLNETIVSAGEEVPDGANIPVADAGTNQNVHNNDVVTLDGSTSSDADGDALTYAWSITLKPGTSGAALSDATVVNPTFTADESGIYVVELIVNDGSVSSAPDEVTVTATLGNATPVADAGIDQSVNTTDIVDLNGSGSTDADTLDILTYSWTITSKPTTSVANLSSATAVNPTFEADLEGIYEVRLIVNDGTVDSASDTVVITASTANSAPVANAGADQPVATGDTVTLDGSGSTDADLDLLTYDWAITSRPGGSSAALSSETAENPIFTADVDGSYVISLVVNDGTVDSDNTDTVTVTATTVVSGIFHNGTNYSTVTSPKTSRVWLDRNLGAAQVCTSSFDTACYGDYYQWGRNYDGHQSSVATTPIQASNVTDTGHGDFIISTASDQYDWGFGADTNGVIRQSNWLATDGSSVCPAGYRVPSYLEMNNETSGVVYDDFSAFENFLKLPLGGARSAVDGVISQQGFNGYLWTSSLASVGGYDFYAFSLYYYNMDAAVSADTSRGSGISVRCIKAQ